MQTSWALPIRTESVQKRFWRAYFLYFVFWLLALSGLPGMMMNESPLSQLEINQFDVFDADSAQVTIPHRLKVESFFDKVVFKLDVRAGNIYFVAPIFVKSFSVYFRDDLVVLHLYFFALPRFINRIKFKSSSFLCNLSARMCVLRWRLCAMCGHLQFR